MRIGIRHLARHLDWNLLFVSLALFTALSAAGWWYYDTQEKAIVTEDHGRLLAIAELKVEQITQWRGERLIDAKILFNNPYTRRAVSRVVSGLATEGEKKELADWLAQAREICEYTNIGVFDSQGRLLMGSGPTVGIKGPAVQAYLEETEQNRDIRMTDLYRNELGQIVLDIYVPLIPPGSSERIPGVLLLRMDPQVRLYPLIQDWPTASLSGEVTLFAREGENALVLNELRHRKGTALTMRRRATTLGLPASSTAQVREDAFEDVDYRGVRVLVALREVPGTDWYLRAKVDLSEAERPLREFQLFMGIAMGMLFLITGSVLVGIWLNRHWRSLQAGE